MFLLFRCRMQPTWAGALIDNKWSLKPGKHLVLSSGHMVHYLETLNIPAVCINMTHDRHTCKKF